MNGPITDRGFELLDDLEEIDLVDVDDLDDDYDPIDRIDDRWATEQAEIAYERWIGA